jgi:hypothetical protein
VYTKRAELLLENELPLLFEAVSVLIVVATAEHLWLADDVGLYLALLLALHQVCAGPARRRDIDSAARREPTRPKPIQPSASASAPNPLPALRRGSRGCTR